MPRFFILLLAMLLGNPVRADAVDILWKRLQPIDSLQAGFVQKVVSDKGAAVQENQGTLTVRKPSYMLWESAAPFREKVVVDGKHVWFYDLDLDQVTVRDYRDDIRQLPALIFGSSRESLASSFSIESRGADEFRLTPKEGEKYVRSLTVRWKGDMPDALLIEDNLGNRTTLSFRNVQLNTVKDNTLFHFVQPANADLVDETREHPLP